MSKLADEEGAGGGVTEVKEPTSGTEGVGGDGFCDVSSNARTGGHRMKLAGDRLRTSKKRCRAELWKLLL